MPLTRRLCLVGAALLAAGPAAMAGDLPDILRGHDAGMSSPSDGAIIIGIEDYNTLPDVRFAERDAMAFRELLVETRGVPPDQVRLYTQYPEREEILSGVRQIASEVGEGGTLWVYYSGHGTAHPHTKERLLLGASTKPDAESIMGRGVPVGELIAAAQEQREGLRMILVLDTCYAGEGRDGEPLDWRFAVPPEAPAAAANVIEWSATSQGEITSSLPEVEHGTFTYFVIGGLRGWADGSGGPVDAQVTLEEARIYVDKSIRNISQGSQEPQLMAGDDLLLEVLVSGQLEAGPELADFQRARRQRQLSKGLLWSAGAAALVSGGLGVATLIRADAYNDSLADLERNELDATPTEMSWKYDWTNRMGFAAQGTAAVALGLGTAGVLVRW